MAKVSASSNEEKINLQEVPHGASAVVAPQQIISLCCFQSLDTGLCPPQSQPPTCSLEFLSLLAA